MKKRVEDALVRRSVTSSELNSSAFDWHLVVFFLEQAIIVSARRRVSSSHLAFAGVTVAYLVILIAKIFAHKTDVLVESGDNVLKTFKCIS